MTLNTTTALLLLSSVGHDYKLENSTSTEPQPQLANNTFVIDVISRVHDFYNFSNIVFYITESIGLKTTKSRNFFDIFWDTFSNVPHIIISSTATNYSMDGFLGKSSLCLVFTTGRNDPIMELAAMSMRGIRYYKTMFILFPVLWSDTFENNFYTYKNFLNIVNGTFEFMWRRQFQNTVLLTIRNNVFINVPYPAPTLVNKSEHWNVTDFFVDYTYNFKGYLVDTPIRFDLPRVFQIVSKNSEQQDIKLISGCSGKIFAAFIDTINATLIDSTGQNRSAEHINFTTIIEQIYDKSIEISIHSYMDMVGYDIGKSYPIGISEWCIMVPNRNRSPDHLYLKYTYQQSTWILMCFSIFYIAICIWFCSPTRPRCLSNAFLQAICSICCLPPTTMLLTPTRRMRFIFVVLFLIGFLNSNIYWSKMSSYLTTVLKQPQINTVNDVIAANLRIMVLEFEYKILESMPHHYPKRFLNQLDVVERVVLDIHRDNMNTSYGYSIQTDRWKFLNVQQVALRKPIFRLSQICMGPYYHAFPMQKDSHFYGPLTYFILYAYQYGLIEYWEQTAFADALRMKYVTMLLVYEIPIPLTLRFFQPVWLIFWIGLLASTLAFIFEIRKQCFQKLRHL